MADSRWLITISISQLKLKLFESGRLVLQAPASVGRLESPTPVGNYIVAKVVTRDSWLHRLYRHNKDTWPGLRVLARWLKQLPVIYDHVAGKADSQGELLLVLKNPAGQYLAEGIHGAQTDFVFPAANTNGCVRLNRGDLGKLAQVTVGTAVVIES